MAIQNKRLELGNLLNDFSKNACIILKMGNINLFGFIFLFMFIINSSLKFDITAKRLYAAQPKSSLTV